MVVSAKGPERFRIALAARVLVTGWLEGGFRARRVRPEADGRQRGRKRRVPARNDATAELDRELALNRPSNLRPAAEASASPPGRVAVLARVAGADVHAVLRVEADALEAAVDARALDEDVAALPELRKDLGREAVLDRERAAARLERGPRRIGRALVREARRVAGFLQIHAEV